MDKERKNKKNKSKSMVEEIAIPAEVAAALNSFLHIKGPKGEEQRKFRGVKIIIKDKKIVVSTAHSRRKERKILYTVKSHIKNMIQGVMENFVYRLQICSIHFPMAVSVNKEKNVVVIKNFLGETKERTAKILPNTDIKIEKEIIIVTGPNKESVGQTAANIETATRIKARDRRIFQDGIFIISKAGKEIGE